jgi:uncharacterized protein
MRTTSTLPPTTSVLSIVLWLVVTGPLAGANDYPVQPVPFNQVKLADEFWAPRIRLNHERTIPFAFEQSEKAGQIKNFDVAAGRVDGGFCSLYPFDDSDVFKMIEGASYSLQTVPDSKLETFLDQLIARIAAAQEPDGYLYTMRTIPGNEETRKWTGSERWELVQVQSHELYNLGHLFEAAAAHFQATGKRSLLDVAVRAADLLVRDFGWGKTEKYPGHPEIEIGLVKLFRVTGKPDYLELARFFVEVRGPGGEEYNQSHLKLLDQREAVGHAVRANYFFSGVADVAALTGDRRYVEAIDRLWENVVSRKLYVTGGVGSTRSGEAYGVDYQLPNLTAYCETCAAIANVFWNQRMFLLHGESKYVDVLERTLYNGVLSGLALSGDRFFYPNPLQSWGQHERQAWFGCACCPSNLTRFLPSVPGYVYAVKDDRLYVNLFIEGKATIDLSGRTAGISQESRYPWDGEITLRFDRAAVGPFEVALRIPGWARGEAVPSDLYRFPGDSETGVSRIEIRVNGRETDYRTENGYAVLMRDWQNGDEIRFSLPMSIRRVQAHPSPTM